MSIKCAHLNTRPHPPAEFRDLFDLWIQLVFGERFIKLLLFFHKFAYCLINNSDTSSGLLCLCVFWYNNKESSLCTFMLVPPGAFLLGGKRGQWPRKEICISDLVTRCLVDAHTLETQNLFSHKLHCWSLEIQSLVCECVCVEDSGILWVL